MDEPNRNPRRGASICLALLCLAVPATAQLYGPVRSDLDGDGVTESFTLVDTDVDTGDGIADLMIETPSGTIRAPDIASVGGIGQKPELTLAPNGALRLTAMNEAIGRSRWHLTLTIAHRQGAYRVAGYTYAWYDTLNLDDRGTCDLNLLTGRGTLQIAEGPVHEVRTSQPAVPVTDWRDDAPIPAVCNRPG